MTWPGDLNSIHNPASNTAPPATWGDAVRDALQWLVSWQAAEVQTSQTTTSTSYTDLSTAGPAVTVETLTTALVIFGATFFQTTGGTGRISFAVSGATSIAASDTYAIAQSSTATGISGCRVVPLTGLTAGSNTFTLKYKTSANTLNASNRFIWVIPGPT